MKNGDPHLSVSATPKDSPVAELQAERQLLKSALDHVKASEEQIRKMLTELDNVFESSPDGIRVIDRHYNVVRTNSRYRLFVNGVSDERKCYESACCNQGKGTDRCSVANILGGALRTDHEVSFVGSDDVSRILMITATPLRGMNGEVEGIVEHFREITEWKELQRRMSHLQKMESIGQLAAGIAHEINTPTQYVGDNVSFLKDGFASLMVLVDQLLAAWTDSQDVVDREMVLARIQADVERADLAFLREEIPQAIEQSQEGISRIARIVKAIKDFSHPGVEDAQMFDVNQCIQSTVLVASNEWKHVSRVDLDFARDLPSVYGYLGEFNQAILNIVVNAVHAVEDKSRKTGDKGLIRIETARRSDWVCITLSDTGIGISEDVRERIFDPFFTTKAMGKGTGQGLAIAHACIVDKHGGTIDVESTMGEGTTFRIGLPASVPERVSISKRSNEVK